MRNEEKRMRCLGDSVQVRQPLVATFVHSAKEIRKETKLRIHLRSFDG